MNDNTIGIISISLFLVFILVIIVTLTAIFSGSLPAKQKDEEEVKRVDRRTSVVISSNKDRALLFSTGFIQVAFVGANSYLVAKYVPLGIFMTSFAISLIWSHNIRKVVFGGGIDRFLYALGAAFGALAGSSIAFYLVK